MGATEDGDADGGADTIDPNPTMQYRSLQPVRVVGELSIWQGHSAEQVKAMKDGLERLKQQGIEAED